MKKKMWRVFLALILALSMLSTLFPYPALAIGGSAVYSVGTAEAVPGETVTVPVNLENEITGGTVFATLLITYDSTNLELLDAQPGSALSGVTSQLFFNAANKKDNISYCYDDDSYAPITASGEVILLTFHVKNDATVGEHIISVKESPSDIWFYDADWEDSGVIPTVNAGSIEVVGASVSAPIITSQPVGGTYTVGDSVMLNIAAESAGGDLSYQWFSNTIKSNTGGTPVGHDNNEYSTSATIGGTIYYYCEVTDTSSGETTVSDCASVVVNADTPVITQQPVGATYYWYQGITAEPLTVAASAYGILSYQWYHKTSGSFSPISGATGLIYTPPAPLGPSISYYCRVTSTSGTSNAFINSDTVVIAVTEASPDAIPVPITVDGDTVNGTVSAPASAVAGYPVTVAAKPDPGYVVRAKYSVNGGATWTNIAGGCFIMPHADVMITVEFTQLTTDEVHTISTAEELKAFADAVNGGKTYEGESFCLDDDIDLSAYPDWTPIGFYASASNVAKPFKGTFDGLGHSVTGLNVTRETGTAEQRYLGLFGYIENAAVRNLSVDGSVTARTWWLFNQNSSDASGRLIYDRYQDNAAGIVGYAKNSSIENCNNYATVTAGGGDAAGIAMYVYDSSVSGCANYGTISTVYTERALNEDYRYAGNAGGVVGTTDTRVGTPYDGAPPSVFITGCANYGDISVDKTKVNATGGSYAGGIIASIGYAPTIVDSCLNAGTISGGAFFTGGIYGVLSQRTSAVSNCYNIGTVSSERDVPSPSHANDPLIGGIGGSDGIRLAIRNCYNAGSIVSLIPTNVGQITPKGTIQAINCYTASQSFDAANLGGAFKTDTNTINGGRPLLFWQSPERNTGTYTVTFQVTTATSAPATVTVYTDAARTQLIAANSNGTYTLGMGQYYYTISAPGHRTEQGSFNVTYMNKTVRVALTASAAVTITVSPATAELVVVDNGGNPVAADSRAGGVFTYTLYVGRVYMYTATAAGYNGTSREFSVPAEGLNLNVTLTSSSQNPGNPTIKGGQTITAGGIYNVGRNESLAQGVITVNTPVPVTLVGTGASRSDAFRDLYINCLQAGTDLKIQDLYISNELGTANTINFTGTGNKLRYAGTNIIDLNSNAHGYAMIHVKRGDELTISGANNDALYLYKREQGAGIGGNGGASGGDGQTPEYNGRITIDGGNLFIKGSKQGAVIGSGAVASSTGGSPGDIIIRKGVLTGVSVARGALLGGGAGSSGGAKGADVHIYGGTLNLNVDYSGSAIGGGGYDAGNDSDGGTLYYHGGSIRTYVDYNAVDPNGDRNTSDSLWKKYGVTSQGVSSAVITAEKVNGEGKPVYLATLDTSKLSKSASSFTVLDGTRTIYTGGRHQYRYINENLYKTEQVSINYTMDNWRSLNDPNLYLYLTGEDHILTVNGEKFDAKWDTVASVFTVAKQGTGGSDTAVTTKTVEIKVTTDGPVSTAKVDSSILQSAVTDALAEAKKNNTAAGVELKINAPDTSRKVQTVIPADAFKSVAVSEVVSLTVTTPVGAVKLDAVALDSISAQARGTDVTLSVAKIDNGTLTKEQQKAVGTGTVVDLSVTSGSAAIHDFGGGKATVTLPYTLKSGETAEGIVVWYLDDAGKLNQCEDAVYDANSGTVTFTTPHFSLYVVDYNLLAAWKNPFTDVAKTAWYYESVWYAFTNGLFKGISSTTFSPDTAMTRGMFVTVLGQLDGVKAGEFTTSGFSDIKPGQWYAPYVEWAAQEGIVTGVGGGKFAPDKAITREEMAAILYSYAKYKGLDVTKIGDLAAFTDAAGVSAWAAPAVKWTASAEIISGMGDGRLAPKATATRAQVATILQRFCENIE